MKNLKKNKKIPLSITIYSAVILLIIGYLLVAYTTHLWPFKTADTTSHYKENNKPSYEGPTEQEDKASQDGKKNSVDTPTPDTDISVSIAYAGLSVDKTAVEIRAFTADVIEGTGVCTATLSQGNSLVTGSAKAFIDAGSSICEAIIIPLDKFPAKGRWLVSVSYESPKHSGTSHITMVAEL